MSPTHSGILAMVTACTIWGLSPIYYRAIGDVPALEILTHRTIWSVVLLLGVLLLARRLNSLARRDFLRVSIAALMIAVNWFLFIFSVQAGQVVQTALGYFIFPLCAVALGALILGEKLSKLQWIAIGLAAFGVILKTYVENTLPTIALALAVTFAIYGVVKKPLDMGPRQSVFWETTVLLPFALGYLIYLVVVGQNHFGAAPLQTGLLIGSGLVTGGPLVLMAFAIERLKLATVGIIQYLNPSLQFFTAVVIFMEPFEAFQILPFLVIWAAIILYSVPPRKKSN